MAIESKASRNVGPSDLRGLASFAECYGKSHRALVFYLGAHRRKIGAMEIFLGKKGSRRLASKKAASEHAPAIFIPMTSFGLPNPTQYEPNPIPGSCRRR